MRNHFQHSIVDVDFGWCEIDQTPFDLIVIDPFLHHGNGNRI